MANEDPVIVYQGTQAEAEALHAMLTARGVASAVTRDREVEGGTAPVEAMILVPPDQAAEAADLIADVKSGGAAR